MLRDNVWIWRQKKTTNEEEAEKKNKKEHARTIMRVNARVRLNEGLTASK